ncbi:MAG: thioredoxin family protein, partial [Planctomycetota bacterium]
MPATASTMLDLGTPCPAFDLPDFGAASAGAGRVARADLVGSPATVVMFICNHCPFVHHVQASLVGLAAEFTGEGVRFVAINSNDVAAHPDDAPEAMVRDAKKHGYSFPYLFDETQEVAKAFNAACTPDFFVFDKDLLLTYRGQLDSTRPRSGDTSSGEDLRAAIRATLAGEAIEQQTPSMGCNIKWKPG